MFRDQINLLTEFSPAIIYELEYESTRLGSMNLVDTTIPEYLQHLDLLNAYLVAQEQILPRIRDQGILNIEPEQWLDWIKAIHLPISRQLALRQNFKGGEFRSEMVSIFYQGTKVPSYIAGFFEVCDSLTLEQQRDYIHRMAFELGCPLNLLQDFIDLLLRIETHAFMPLNAEDSAYLTKKDFKRTERLLLQLSFLVLERQLTSEEQNLVASMVKICPRPVQIQNLIVDFSISLNSKLKNLDLSDLDAVSALMAEVFWELTSIHPFSNANGRLALCFINTLLRAMNHPAILLYRSRMDDREKENDESQYSRAISVIENNRSPLHALIAARIEEAREGYFTDPRLVSLLDQRVYISELMVKFQKTYPWVNLQSFYDLESQRAMNQSVMNKGFFQNIPTSEQNMRAIEVLTQKISAGLQNPDCFKDNRYFKAKPEAKRIKEILATLSLKESEDWGFALSKGKYKAWCECSSENEASRIGDRMKACKMMKTKTAHDPSKGIFMVIVDDFDFDNLLNTIPAPDPRTSVLRRSATAL